MPSGGDVIVEHERHVFASNLYGEPCKAVFLLLQDPHPVCHPLNLTMPSSASSWSSL